MGAPASTDAGRGVLFAIAAYTLWGLLPLYMKLLDTVPPLQVVAHRVLWSLALLGAMAIAWRRIGGIVRAPADRRVVATLAATALLISANWLIYIWAVQHDHVLATSLGYFINPLLNVLLAVLFLKERLRAGQTAALALAGVGVAVMAFSGSGALWIALGLALTFGLYGVLRKIVAIDAFGGLATETAMLGPIAALYLLWTAHAGQMAWGTSPEIDFALVGSGAITAAPLLLFALAARRMRLISLSIVQYLAPTIQFFSAVLLFHEPLTKSAIITFAFIWTGIALYLLDTLRADRGTPPPPLRSGS